ncbi:MAG: S1C family serine protease [Planctomycetota bacterium]
MMVLSLGALVRPAAGQLSLLEQLDQEVTSLTSAIRKSVVHVTVQPSALRLREKRDADEGDGGVTLSGLIVADDGLIATVADPLRSGDRYMVELATGQQERASLVAIDEPSGIGFLRIKVRDLPLIKPYAGATLAPGALLVALGHGRPQSATPSVGFVIGVNREAGISRTVHQDLIEVSAGTSADDRGGILVRPSGEVVALIIGSPEQVVGFGEIPLTQVCFGIPIRRVLKVRDDVLAASHPGLERKDGRGWLGIRAQDLPAALREKWPLAAAGGVLVQTVVYDSPAHQAGLHPNDIILAWGGERVTDSLQLLSRVEAAKAGTQVQLEVLRDGEPLKLLLVLGEW